MQKRDLWKSCLNMTMTPLLYTFKGKFSPFFPIWLLWKELKVDCFVIQWYSCWEVLGLIPMNWYSELIQIQWTDTELIQRNNGDHKFYPWSSMFILTLVTQLFNDLRWSGCSWPQYATETSFRYRAVVVRTCCKDSQMIVGWIQPTFSLTQVSKAYAT